MSNQARIAKLIEIHDGLDNLMIIGASANNLVSIKQALAGVVKELQQVEQQRFQIIQQSDEKRRVDEQKREEEERIEARIKEALEKEKKTVDVVVVSSNGNGEEHTVDA